MNYCYSCQLNDIAKSLNELKQIEQQRLALEKEKFEFEKGYY